MDCNITEHLLLTPFLVPPTTFLLIRVTQPPHLSSTSPFSQPANVKLKRLPFYDIHGELLQPTALVAQGSSRFQEAQFQFLLSPSQVSGESDHL